MPEILFLAAENKLGGENKGIYVLFSGLDIERVIVAAMTIGYLYL